MSEKSVCYLNALGIINALGNNKSEVAANLFAGKRPGMVERNDLLMGKQIYVAQVNAQLPAIPENLWQYQCRNNQLLLAALDQITAPVELAIARYGVDRVAVVLGSSTSGIDEGEKALAHLKQLQGFPQGFHYKQQEIGTCAEFLADYLKLENLAYTVSTACSSSAKAFASAQLLLTQGICDAVLVGGVDSLCQLTLNGFSALESVSSGICNPFSQNRDGITIGEGAALFLMTREESEIALFGVGESSDAYHISSPQPEGEGAEIAIRAALAQANLAPQAIDYVNLHGTATPKNDEMESRVIQRIFGEQLRCSSTKAQIGHTLGAAGANEVGFCWLTLSEYNLLGQLPPQIWDGQADNALPVLNFVSPEMRIKQQKSRYLLSNSFAFGGSNAAVIIGDSMHALNNSR